MSTALVVAAVWILASIPVGLLVGAMLRAGESCRDCTDLLTAHDEQGCVLCACPRSVPRTGRSPRR